MEQRSTMPQPLLGQLLTCFVQRILTPVPPGFGAGRTSFCISPAAGLNVGAEDRGCQPRAGTSANPRPPGHVFACLPGDSGDSGECCRELKNEVCHFCFCGHRGEKKQKTRRGEITPGIPGNPGAVTL